MVNAKFELGNKILIISRYYAIFRYVINTVIFIVFTILFFTVKKEDQFNWVYFYVAMGFAAEMILIWIFKVLLYGYGLIVCNSAHDLSVKKVVTYVDLIEARKEFAEKKLTQEDMNKIEEEYHRNNFGLIDY